MFVALYIQEVSHGLLKMHFQVFRNNNSFSIDTPKSGRSEKSLLHLATVPDRTPY